MLQTKYGENIMFCVLEEDVQQIARRKLNRVLSKSELESVKKGLEWGFEDWWITVESAIDNAVVNNNK